MIAVKNSGNFVKGALEYNDKKVKKSEATILSTNVFFSHDKDVLTENFNNWNRMNPKIKENTLHISISLDPNDQVSNGVFNQIGRDFMNEIGYEHQPYIIYLHKDRKHSHLHIVTSTIDEKGRRMSDSHDYRTFMSASRVLEEKYNLTKALEKKKTIQDIFLHAKSISNEKPQPLLYHFNTDVREDITHVMDYVLKNEYITNKEQLIDRLKEFNVGLFKTFDSDNSIGHTLYILNEQGEKMSKGIRNSNFKKSLHLKYVDKTFENNLIKIDKHSKDVSKLVRNVLKQYDKITPKTFQDLMKEYNINVRYNYAEGKINGIGFFDQSKNHNFKGSDIGFTAKIMNETYFDAKDSLKPQFVPFDKDAYNEKYNKDVLDVLTINKNNMTDDPNKKKRRKRRKPRL